MATAEYTVGTLGAVLVAAVLFKLGLDDGWYFDQLRDIVERALRPGLLIEHLRNIPKLGIGR
jgi:uncharacterized protein DUF4244